MKKLAFWISTLTRDWHLLKHQLFHLSTMEIGLLSTCLKPHSSVSLPHWPGTLVCSGTEPFIVSFSVTYFTTCRNQHFNKYQDPVWNVSHPTLLRQKTWSLCDKSWQINYLFHDVASWSTHHVKQVVWGEILGDPKCHILVCGRILTKWFKFWNCVLLKLW